MAVGPLNKVIRHLRKLQSAEAAGAHSDTQLLERFAALHDEAAFEELVKRLGPMVHGVCRRVLNNTADADDAFQATFLILARKAGSAGSLKSVGSWLHGVAVRTALKARTSAARRRFHERGAARPAAQEPSAEVIWRDLRPVLDEELARLPEKYRRPVLLCYLQGKTQEEAAQELGWPKGTVATRLNRARERLRVRLTRRGLTVPGGLLAALLAQNLAPAAVPAPLAASLIQSAFLFVAGTSTSGVALSAGAVTLAEGVLRTMMLTKVKLAAALVLGAGMLLFGAGVLHYQGQAAQEPKLKQAEAAVPPAPKAVSRLEQLLKSRLEVAEKILQARILEYRAGRATLDTLSDATRNLLTARLDLAKTKAERVAAWQTYLKITTEMEDFTREMYEAGKKAFPDYLHVQYYRLEAEIGLERIKAK